MASSNPDPSDDSFSPADGFKSWSELPNYLDQAAKAAAPDGKDAVDLLLEDRSRRNRVNGPESMTVVKLEKTIGSRS